MNSGHATHRSLRAAIAFALTYLMVWGGVPAPALAEMAEEAMTEEAQTNSTKSQEQAKGQPQEQELGTEGGAGQVEPQAQEPQLTVQGDQPSETITVESEPVGLTMEGGQSNEELLNAYVQHKLDETLEQSAGVQLGVQSAADGLTSDNDRRMYQLLKEKVSSVAAGNLESTVFTFSPEELLGQGNTGPFTAIDLGVDAVVVNGEISQDALNKMWAKINGDYVKVWRALLADCPYDFYWHDRIYANQGAGIYPFRQKLSSIKTVWSGGEYRLTFDGDITITLLAAKEYSKTKQQGTTNVDTALIKQTNGVVDKAVKKAQSIVSDNQNKSNLDKLKAYKDAICTEVSYNTAAAQNQSTPYGNPWQLIWAFDGDESTTVVCEGYSKAFKYLCDLTWQGENPEVECLLVTGTMSGGTGAGAHMWNIVRMDDNRNYLVDVTNCDTGTIGASEKLFMVCKQGGSYASGYSFPLSQTMAYVYDSDTKNAFGEAALTLSETAYTGPAEKIRVSVPVAATGLVYKASSQTGVSAGTGFKVQNGSAVNAGNYTATATLESGYMWDDGTTAPKQVPWSIAKRQVLLIWSNESFTYDGNPHCPTVRVDGTYSGDTITVTVDGAQTNAGSYNARVTAISNDNYSLPSSTIKAFEIKPVSLTAMTLEAGPFVHDGTPKTPAVTSVKAGSLTVPSSGYTVSYANNVNVGTAKATVTGTGNFTGSVTTTFTITEASINTATIAEIPAQTYTGSEIRPTPTVKVGSKTLEAGTDYSVSYTNNVNAGTATVTITGKGSYKGSKSTSFKINPAQLTAVTLATTNFTYDGGAKKPAVSSVKAGSLTVPASSYSVSYASNVNAGTATATVTGMGNYGGTATAEFTIAKAVPEVTKAPVAKTLTYSGGAQALVSAGTASGGTMLYSLNNGTWTATVPSATNAGSYSVRYKVQGDANHNSIEGASPVLVTIQKKTISPVVTIAGWTYGGTASQPQTSANPGNGAVTYTYGKASDQVGQYTNAVPTKAGDYVVRAQVAETTNYKSGVATASFSIAKAANTLQAQSPVTVAKNGNMNLSACVTGGNGTVTYAIDQALVGCEVTSGGSFTAGATVGTCKVKVSAAGDDNHNAGETTITVQVAEKGSLKTAEVTPAVASYTYDGKAKAPAVTVKLGGKTLAAGVDYDASYEKNVNVGTATVTVTGKGNYMESASGTFRINPAAISAAALTVSPASYTYDGKAKTPGVTAKFNGATLVAGRDYTVAFSNNVNAGTATVTVTGKGNYSGTQSATFRINPAAVSAVSVSPTSFTYDGKAKTPGVTVRAGGITVPASGYSVKYANNTNAGTATVTVTGKGNFAGSKSATFCIDPAAITSVSVSPASVEYDGRAKTPGVTVRAGGLTVPTSGYSVSYANNTNIGTATATVTGKGNFTGTKSATFAISAPARAGVSYQTHVQNIGDQGWRRDGTEAGTHGLSYRLEAIRIKLEGAHVPGSIEYRTHVQNIGWQDYRRDGAEAGTHGLSYRLEAIQIRLTGEMAQRYDVWYCVHAQDIGDMGWARNDAPAGTAGFGRRLEAIRIVVLPKGSAAPGRMHEAFVSRDGSTPQQSFSGHAVRSRTHVQDIGWQGWATDGQMSGTQGLAKRLEGIEVALCDKPSAGGIEYRTHVQNIGWQGYVRDGQMSGTSGRSLRLEAIQLRLTGAMGLTHDVWYRVHAENFGWMGWARNDQQAGTAGFSYRLEGIEILVLPKGTPAPGPTAGAFRQR